MKKKLKLLLIILIVIISKQSNQALAQVTPEQSFFIGTTQSSNQEFFLTNLGNNDYKYVIYDYTLSQFSLYNLNHTPFILNIQIPFNVVDESTNTAYRLGYITRSLFDCDSSNIEYAIMLDSPRPTLHPNFAVYRTNGELIFSEDSVGTMFCVGCGSGSYEIHPIMMTPAGAKLYLFSNTSDASSIQIRIYNLCGNLPENITEINQNDFYVKVFPNPTSGLITFKVIAPNHSEKYELTIFNSAMQTIKTIKIIGEETQININNESLNTGMYFYTLQNKNKIFQTGKFVLSK